MGRRAEVASTWVVVLAAGAAGWSLAAATLPLPAYMLPPPSAVLSALAELTAKGMLPIYVGESLRRILLAALVALAVGVPLGVLLGISRGVAGLVYPALNFFQSVWGIAWLPLAVTWFGLGWASVTFILCNTIFFLVFYNTLVGVRTVPRILEQAVLTLGASRRHVVFQVLVPGAMPNIVNGIRMGIGFGWRALIAAEMIATSSGLGFLIYNASNFHQTDTILVGIVTIGVLWLVTDRLVLQPIERWTVERWGLVSEGR